MITEDQFGFNTFLWDKLHDEESIRGIVKSLADLGYRGVEWKETSFNPQGKLVDEFRRAVRVTKEFGLEVSNFVILRDMINIKTRDKAINNIIECIQAVATIGVDKVNIITGGFPEGMKTEEVWNNLFYAFERLLIIAEKNNVYLIVEPVVGQICHDYFSTQELLRNFNSEYLAITFDPSHYQLYRNDIPWIIKQWKHKIKHVHMKDAVGIAGKFGVDFLFPILGEGSVDWLAFLKALDDINYQGFLSAEFESFNYYTQILNSNPMKAAEIALNSMKRLLAKYKTEGQIIKGLEEDH